MPVFVFPTASEQAPESTLTFVPSAAPVGTCFGKAAEHALLRPDPPSEAENLFRTAVLYQLAPFGLVVGPSLEIVGAFLSTLLPETGPAVVVWLTPSVTSRWPVAALSVSVPPATFVDRSKL